MSQFLRTRLISRLRMFNQLFFSTSATEKLIKIHFRLPEKTLKTVHACKGQRLLSVAHENGIPIEGACEASLACSTCHVILEKEVFMKIPPASEREDDLLDLAPGLTDTSRLSCQVKVTEDLDGTEVKLPFATLNLYVDGYTAPSH